MDIKKEETQEIQEIKQRHLLENIYHLFLWTPRITQNQDKPQDLGRHAPTGWVGWVNPYPDPMGNKKGRHKNARSASSVREMPA